MEALIRTQGMTKIYGKDSVQVTALQDVNIQIEKGEFVSIMGPSGSGKSTLMNILGCLDRPTQGRYFLDGQDVSELDRTQRAHLRSTHIGFVFQSYNLLPRSSALMNVMLPLLYDRTHGYAPAERERMAHEVLERVGLGDRLHHQPQELSGGQSQRVAIARALVNDPLIILADEPTGNLDSGSGEEIMELLHELHGDGRTILMVTHDPAIAAHTQRTIHLLDGRIEKIIENGGSLQPVEEPIGVTHDLD